MKEITRYMAEDGKVFDNKAECEEYEKHSVQNMN